MTLPQLEHRIRVEVETAYLDDQSEPQEQRFVFSYTITIRNEGKSPRACSHGTGSSPMPTARFRKCAATAWWANSLPQARAGLPLLERRRAGNARRCHAGQLPDAG